jgi:hypothetical protein
MELSGLAEDDLQIHVAAAHRAARRGQMAVRLMAVCKDWPSAKTRPMAILAG